MVSSARTHYMNVARVVRPHGKRGEVVVAPLDDLPFVLHAGMSVCCTPPALLGPRWLVVADVRQTSGWPLVSFAGVSTIADAEALAGRLVLARRSDVPEAERERAVRGCEGREVVDDAHGPLGTIVEVMRPPANDVWVVRGPFGEILIPVIDDVVGEIPAQGPVPVTLLAGLLPDEAAFGEGGGA